MVTYCTMDQILSSVVKFVLVSQIIIGVSNANFVFNVQNKFAERTDEFKFIGREVMKKIIEHDVERQGRMLSAAMDFQLGGNGLNVGTAIYYTKLTIGTPPKNYFVTVDTGSNDLWLNCAGCLTCPKSTDLGFNITWYDLKSSSTGKEVPCGDNLCPSCLINGQCAFSVPYLSGKNMSGYFVRDSFNFDKITSDLNISSMEAGDIAFGCATKGGKSSPARAVDGLMGFGQGPTSVLSQLAASGKTKRIFSHCLEGLEGGGIFAIGEVVEPKVQTTPMIPGQRHYNVHLERIEVGGFAVWNYEHVAVKGGLLNITPNKTDAIIDTGSTLTYFPKEIHETILSKIMEKHSDLKTYIVDVYTCFKYPNKNIDADFPVLSLHFENSAVMHTYPRDYLFSSRDDEFCFGLIKTLPGEEIDGKPITLLGNIVMTDKLIVYDLEKMTMGFTEYNCSSSIRVKDESSGNAYSVSAHDISDPSSPYYNVTCGDRVICRDKNNKS